MNSATVNGDVPDSGWNSGDFTLYSSALQNSVHPASVMSVGDTTTPYFDDGVTNYVPITSLQQPLTLSYQPSDQSAPAAASAFTGFAVAGGAP